MAAILPCTAAASEHHPRTPAVGSVIGRDPRGPRPARDHRREPLVRRLYACFPRPDRLFFLDVPPEIAQRRVTARGRDHEELSYLTALREAYRSLPESAEFTVIDASGSKEAVAEELRRQLRPESQPD
ncbi:MAG: dTMP kinase [Micromonosporaceae bacterium]